jgi:hypothetical protein
VGPGATIDTLQTEYPCIQASRQDKEQGVLPHAAACPTAPDLASLPRRAPVLPCVLQPQTSPLCRAGLRCCHVSCSSGPRLTGEEGSGVATCPTSLCGLQASSVKKVDVGPAMHLRYARSQGTHAWQRCI